MPTLPDQAEILRRLVALPSVSSTDAKLDHSNAAVIDELAGLVISAGGSASTFDVDEKGTKQNLIARFGPDEVGLVLSGHTDTVPWDEGRWTSDPFALTEREGRLHGLGSTDMKGFFAAALHALEATDISKLKRGVAIIATADEESTMAGARSLHLDAFRGAACVVGEPTGLIPVTAHKGIVVGTLQLEGRSGHSSDPSLGRSALDGMLAVMNALDVYRRELATRYQADAFTVPYPTMNWGRIGGGDAANRICARCELEFDVRLVPGMTPEETFKEILDVAERAVAGRGLSVALLQTIEPVPPHALSDDDSFAKHTCHVAEAQSKAVLFCTEAPFFAAAGMPTLIWGPGSIDVAHQPNEYVETSELSRATAQYRALIEGRCNQ